MSPVTFCATPDLIDKYGLHRHGRGVNSSPQPSHPKTPENTLRSKPHTRAPRDAKTVSVKSNGGGPQGVGRIQRVHQRGGTKYGGTSCACAANGTAAANANSASAINNENDFFCEPERIFIISAFLFQMCDSTRTPPAPRTPHSPGPLSRRHARGGSPPPLKGEAERVARGRVCRAQVVGASVSVLSSASALWESPEYS